MSLHLIKTRIKQFLPVWFLSLYYRQLRREQVKRDSVRSAREVFSEVYKSNSWGGKRGQLYSGYGSRFAQAERYVGVVVDFIKQNNITDVVDLGCGDFEIGKHIAPACANYVGVDVVPAVIESNQKQFGGKHIRFECLDITEDTLPNADLCLIRQVFQHLSNSEIIKVLAKARKYKYLIVTEHFSNTITTINKDIVHGRRTRVEENSAVFLEKPPFNVADLELLLEVRLSIANRNGKSEEHVEGIIRTFKVTL
jgi:SAM-dependent methyltransferase